MAYTDENTYYNTFDPAKKYFEVRALAGYVEQSREDNEIQSILMHVVKKLGDTIWSQGEIISGGGYGRSNPTSTNVISFNSTKIYIDGIIHDVDAKTLTIGGSGLEEVGICLVKTVITSVDDPDLRDPASGFANYGQPGANRLKIEGVWSLKTAVAAGDKFYPVYKFKDGIEIVKPQAADIDIITQQLARRTYDESGNYIVAGFDLAVEPKDDAELFLKIGSRDSIGVSKAYVQGYEVVKYADERKAIEKALGKRSLSGEERAFSLDSLSETENPPQSKLKITNLDFQPVADISKVETRFEAIQIVSGHVAEASTVLPAEASINVIKVFSGPSSDPGSTAAGQITYVNAVNSQGYGDYYVSGNTIYWNVANSTGTPEPSNFYVYYTFKKVLTKGQDYELSSDGALDLSKLSELNTNNDGWIAEANRKVAVYPYGFNRALGSSVSTTIEIDYEYYLPRIDSIYLDENGEVKIQKGEYAADPSIPFVSAAKLILGHVYLAANGGHDKAVLQQYNVKRLTMAELRKLYDRLERVEFNQAIQDLNTAAINRAGPTNLNLSSIFTESFTYTDEQITNPYDAVGNSRIKFNRDKTTNKIFNVPYREMSVAQLDRQVSVDWGNINLAGSNLERTGSNNGCITLAGTLRTSPLISSLEATGTIQVNQFDEVIPRATLDVTPNILPSERNELTILTYDPMLLGQVFQTQGLYQHDGSSVSGNTNLTNAITLPQFASQKWIWCKGAGFAGGEVVSLKVGGFAVELTVSPSVVGEAYSADQVPSAPAAGFLGVTDNPAPVNNIYGVTSRILCNAKGEFLVAFKTPKGITSGNISVQAFGQNGTSAATVVVADSQLTLSTANGLSPFKEVEPPTVVNTIVFIKPELSIYNSILSSPPAVEFFVSDAAMNPVNPGVFLNPPAAFSTRLEPLTSPNLSGSKYVIARINRSPDGGDANVIKFNRTKLTSAGQSQELEYSIPSEMSPSLVYYIYLGQVTQAFSYSCQLLGTGGESSIFSSQVSFNGQGSTTNPPAFTSSITVSTNSNSFAVGDPVTFVYGNVSGEYTQVKVTIDNVTGSPVLLPPANSNGVKQGTVTAKVSSVGSGKKATLTFTAPSGAQESVVSGGFNVARRNDPLAQTFKVSTEGESQKGMFVKSVKVYFSEKPTDAEINKTIFAYLVPTVNGYPAPIEQSIARSATKSPVDVQVSSTATLATEFEFTNIAYLEPGKSYAVVLYTPSSKYKVFVGQVGGELIRNSSGPVTGGIKTAQSISDGSLFEGATTDIWSPRPQYDLVFELIEYASFANSGTFNFVLNVANAQGIDEQDENSDEVIANKKFVGFYINPRQFVPFSSIGQIENNYKIVWTYATTGAQGETIQVPFQPNNYVFPGKEFTTIAIRATFISTDGKLTPVIIPSNMAITGVFRGLDSVYESNVITCKEAYSSIELIADMSFNQNSNGSSVKWYISDNISINPSSLPTWAATTAYSNEQIVKYNSKYYMAKGNAPANALNPNPATLTSYTVSSWAPATTYTQGTVVLHGSYYYMATDSIIGNVSNQSPSIATDKWTLVGMWELVDVEESGRLWRQVPVTLSNPQAGNVGFKEYSNSISLSSNSQRKQYLIKVKCSAPAGTLGNPPRVRNLIAIANS